MNKETKTAVVVSSHDIQLDSDYVKWICDVKQRFRNTQIKAAVKVNSEQLLFNWQMGRDLVVRKAEDTWGAGIVERVSLDLQNEFPLTKGFSARNLWNMKKWYSFYSSVSETEHLLQNLTEQLDLGSIKLHQIGAEIEEITNNEKLHQVGAEMRFPTLFGFVPWRHHVEIVNRCKSVDETLFYIKKTIENGLSRNALIDILKADLYHTAGTAVTNFYVNAVNELIRTPDENPTIGLLICKDKDQTEVQWAFQGIQTPMGVASYDKVKLQEIQAQLPTAEQIQQRIALAEEEYRLRIKEQ